MKGNGLGGCRGRGWSRQAATRARAPWDRAETRPLRDLPHFLQGL